MALFQHIMMNSDDEQRARVSFVFSSKNIYDFLSPFFIISNVRPHISLTSFFYHHCFSSLAQQSFNLLYLNGKNFSKLVFLKTDTPVNRKHLSKLSCSLQMPRHVSVGNEVLDIVSSVSCVLQQHSGQRNAQSRVP